MLILSRKRNETVLLTLPDGTEMTVVCVEIRGDKVRLGFDCPREVAVHRSEVQRAIKADGGDVHAKKQRRPKPAAPLAGHLKGGLNR